MFTAEALLNNESRKIPSCLEIGLQASRKGDFQTARQMFRISMEQLEGQTDTEQQEQYIELLIHTADTFMNEGAYESAKQWYEKALNHPRFAQNKNTIEQATVLTKLAEICVLEDNLAEFQTLFDKAQYVYLFVEETDTHNFLNALVDLSWALCVKGNVDEVQLVNDLITQIKQLEEELLSVA